MNTRQLSQGLVPTEEYERSHAFKSFRQFPELRMSSKEVEEMKLRKHKERGAIMRTTPLVLKSTHRLDELSRSSLDEVSSVMTDYRKILMENRRANREPLFDSSLGGLDDASASFSLSAAGSTKTDPLINLSSIERADHKLTKISISFDAKSYNSHLNGFQGSKLKKHEFETLLRRCLNIVLTKAELDALFAKMDVDGSGMIDGVEFIRYFFALGNAARWKMQLETVTIRAKKLEMMKRRRQEEEAKIKAWEASQIAKYSDEDRETALQKLQSLSITIDTLDDLDSLVLRGFSALLTPYQFKVQLSKAFGLRLTHAEVRNYLLQ